MKMLLRLKAWQLFVLIYGASIVISLLQSAFDLNSSSHALLVKLQMFFTAVGAIVMLAWIWTVSTIKMAEPDSGMSGVGAFKIVFSYATLYFLIVVSYLLISSVKLDFRKIFIPHILACISMIYCILFVARRISTAENKRTVTFSEYSGLAFLVLFFPFGLWVLQRKVNNLMGNTPNRG